MAGRADSYEFNAPKHFFDFTKGDIEVDESYFDTLSETPQKTPAAHVKVSQSTSIQPFPEAGSQPSPTQPIPKVESQPSPKQPISETGSQPSPTQPIPEAGSQPSPTQPIPEACHLPSATSLSAARSTPRKVSQAMAGLDTVGVRQSPRLAAIAKALRRNRAARKSIGKSGTRLQESHGSRTRKRGVSKVSGGLGLSAQDEADLQAIANVTHKTGKDSGPTKPHRLTKVEEFHFATDSRMRGPKPAAEEVAPVSVPVRPHTGPTRPQEFHFATNARIKGKEPPHQEHDYVDFSRSLRSSSTSLNKDGAATNTVPQPFKLTESRRRNPEEASKFVSVAELNRLFHTKTPQRFRTKRAGEVIQEDAKRTKPNPQGITIPHTPQLNTRTRSRPANCLSQQQIELKAFEEAQKQTFKARPINKKVLAPPSIGLTVEKKLPTVPEPFNITESKKAAVTRAEEDFELVNESTTSITSLSHGGKKPATKIKPFSFDSRDQAKQQQKQEKIRKFIQEEKSLAEFHAQPMPSFVNGDLGVPAKKPPTPTKLQPFNLQADQRGLAKQEKFKAQLDEESQVDAEQRKFHARPGSVVHMAPFIPEKSQRPLTEISGFALNTEVRAGKRNEYDLQRKMYEEDILAAKKVEEEQQAVEEAAEIARLRQEAVHKANPMPKFKAPVLQLPHHPVTIPKSPKFATESRLRSKSRANSTLNISSATYTAE